MRILEPREGYDLFAPDYRGTYDHLDSFDWNGVTALLWPLLADLAATGRPASLLDAGCGDGRALGRMMKQAARTGLTADWWGWDISPAMLKVAAKRLDQPATLVCRDCGDTPGPKDMPPDGFNLATAFFVLVHFRHPGDFFVPLAQAMAPGGTVLVNTIPQREGFVVGKGRDAFMIDYHHHEADDVADAMEAAGLTMQRREDGPWSTLLLGQKEG